MPIFIAEMQTMLETLTVEGLVEDYRPSFLIEPHCHATHQIVHAVDGVMRVSAKEGIWVVPPGRALWIPAGVVHSIRCIGEVRMRTVYLGGPHAAFPAACTVWFISPLMREVLVRIARGAPASLLPHLSAVLLAEIATVEVTPLTLPQPNDPRLRAMCEALLGDPADRRTLAEWARSLGLSQRTLIGRFRAETGSSFRNWRRQARLLRSLELLGQGRDVTSTALEVGYATPSAFVEAFRLATGMTPSRYFR